MPGTEVEFITVSMTIRTTKKKTLKDLGFDKMDKNMTTKARF